MKTRPSRAQLPTIVWRAKTAGDANAGLWENAGVDGLRARPGHQSSTYIAGRTPMLTRRSLMLASIAAGVTMNSKTASAKAAQPLTPVNFEVPAGACDLPHPYPRRSRKVFRSLPAASTRRNWPRPRKCPNCTRR